MLNKLFQRRIENFSCEHCGAHILGNGYTNHCPQCLWSKHVDVSPGDRASSCNSLMKPVAVTKNSDTYSLTHRCCRCGYEKQNRLSKNDDMDAVIELSRKLAHTP